MEEDKKFKFSISIEKIANGYITTDEEDICCFEIDEMDEFGDIKALRKCLYEIIEYFGCYGSKHDKKRLRVEIIEQKDE